MRHQGQATGEARADLALLTAEQAAQQLGGDLERGLSEAEAARRLAEHGPNELAEHGGRSPWAILWEQLTGVMVLVLIAAAVLSAFLGDIEDMVAILAIVVLNTLLGFSQEYRAERAMAALRAMAVPTVRARRDGRVREISARDLVPGDVVLIEAGSRIPADGRLVEAANLRVQEAALTGESEAVDKHVAPLGQAGLPLGDRRNMAYLGTAVTYGRGRLLVGATGMRTELGRIAGMIQAVAPEPTPLQRRLDRLGRLLVGLALVIVVVVFVLGLLRGEDWRQLLLTAVSLAVAAAPEGLPAVVTIALALGAQRMLRRQALIRKLPAVETLGSVTVICSDKTGTLTANQMRVVALDVAGQRADMSPGAPATSDPDLLLLLAGGALASDAELQEGPAGVEALGDPTEAALVLAAAQAGLRKGELDAALPRVAEAPFDSLRKRMTTVHRAGGDLPPALAPLGAPELLAITKGAVDGLLEICETVLDGGRRAPLDAAWRARIDAANARLAGEGMRVLGLAVRSLSAPAPAEPAELERALTFVGLVGMIDPPRPEVRAAVATCVAAGIRPIMITGDHPLTALAIARDLGIASDDIVVTGVELQGMGAAELDATVLRASVYARVAPEHKLQIVQALQRHGQIVAMTGDGVNDAPALRQADIGVAMGLAGTDVAREAGDMVLRDDNFATIVAAVREGRVIYANIRKFIRYILTGNIGEIAVMLLAPLAGMPLPLLPLQILWINLVTDGLPALALGVERAEPDLMQRPPRPPGESVLSGGMGWQIGLFGALIGALSLGVGALLWWQGSPAWQTAIFTTLTFAQMASVLAIRSEREPLLRAGLLSNPLLLGAVALTAALQLLVVYLPAAQPLFETHPLSAGELGLCLAASLVVLALLEAAKLTPSARS